MGSSSQMMHCFHEWQVINSIFWFLIPGNPLKCLLWDLLNDIPTLTSGYFWHISLALRTFLSPVHPHLLFDLIDHRFVPRLHGVARCRRGLKSGTFLRGSPRLWGSMCFNTKSWSHGHPWLGWFGSTYFLGNSVHWLVWNPVLAFQS